MARSITFRGAAALLTAAAFAACSDTTDIVRPPAPANALFTSYVALGNSITAGYQSSGINDSTQRETYAYLLATQAMQTRFAYPSIAMPGCPPPIGVFATGARVGGGTSTTCAGRNPASLTQVLNDVAVPGATVFDPTSLATASSNVYTGMVLGGRTQVDLALRADPTFATVWIGNNDALAAALSGRLVPTPGISPGLTDSTKFLQAFTAIVNGLSAAPHLQGAAVIGVADVANAPALFPGGLLVNPATRAVKVAFDQMTATNPGDTVVVDPSCATSPTSLISLQIVSAIRAGQHPRAVACTPQPTGIGDVFVLDPAEIATLEQTVAAYNRIIAAQALNKGWVYLDPNPALVQLRQTGAVPLFPNPLAEHPFGDYFSNDGVHPARPAQVIVANALVEAINAKYSTNLGTVQ